ncbi:VCBS repeat-containing protein [Polaribacter sp. Z022]|uniref:VCBS repeat-containing protein n=1 Tax=Polaribacter sp. Z022 TaxID=2927125 RepID=UPI00202190E6|nr:VCBS repeat-containing protein [Polaribacter sp. Z022]MCL7753503.1 VCBS repeat-containing protein [Polaribacter sp. Z022]
MHKKNLLYLVLLLILCNNCNNKNKQTTSPTLFNLVDNNITNINFKNTVKENLYFNFLNFAYIYNGGGVAVGDINNDGLEDIYFTSNQNSNKLYLNKGNLEFEDITLKAQVSDEIGWTTGVTMIDINNDGWLDIYACKSGSFDSHQNRKNKLFINQKNNTFKEKGANYNLDHYGFSTQAYFFDFDNDDDLDMYLVNHRQDFRNNINIDPRIQQTKEDYNSDQLFRNDGTTFTNVTKEAGILNKAWGLSASIGDFNNDNLPDVFVANDFLEPDFLYINQGNGTFKDEALKHFNHISSNSMGSDFADINNDLQPDLVVLDMMAEDHIRGKENMATMSISNFHQLVNIGYHHQYMSNMLQLNNGNGTFSEIGQLAGIAKTDWSWAPLIADFDNDGFNDIFITNGIEHDLSNQDFRNQMRNNIRNRKKVSLEQAIKMMPSHKLSNYIFKNQQNLTFKNETKNWGFNTKINSNGAVYADLDNDGDLDLIVNNQAEKASIYQNNSTNNYISFSFKGSNKNSFGIGAKISVFSENLQQTKQHYASRGFQSSVGNTLNFGIGNNKKIDSVIVQWKNGKQQILTDVKINTNTILEFKNATKSNTSSKIESNLFEAINPSNIGINYTQKENTFDDFKIQILLPQKQSEKGAAICVADINNDGLDDFFVGNAKGKTAAIFVQTKSGKFIETNKFLFDSEKEFEDTDATFLDIDNDGDLDLYVSSGGYEIESNNKFLQDRVYINNGKGNFKKGVLPTMLANTKGIAFADYDKDGDIDIFIGGNVKHGQYPLSDKPYFLENNNGKYTNVIDKKFDNITNLKMINDAVFTDFDNDGDKDLIVVGEWMPITIYENKNANFFLKEIEGITPLNGWFQSIIASDIDKDGNIDYIVGNWGKNNKFHPTKEMPLHIYADYFDDNKSFDIALSKVSKTGDLLPVRGKECSTQQTPFLGNKVKTFREFAASTMPEIYGSEKLKNAHHYVVHNFATVILKNKGNGEFKIQELPKEAQFSPTLSTEIIDINNDGILDILGVGNIYSAEVETIRYDASKGFILLGNKENILSFTKDNGYFNNKEAIALKKININGKLHLIILNKNSELTILKIKK